MDYVWQYLYEPSFFRKGGLFNELEYSIRSVKKNAPPGRYFVVGDKPPVSHEDVIHIPVAPTLEGRDIAQKNCRDKFTKMSAMAYSDEIGDTFVLLCDDNFIMQPVTVEDLKINWARAEIKSIDEYIRSEIRTGTTSYKRTWRSSYESVKLLRDMKGLKTYDWETHTPRFLVKEKLKYVVSTFDFVDDPKHVTAVYDGLYAENTQIITSEIQSDLWAHQPKMDLRALLDVPYLNIGDDIIVPEFIQIMEEKFGVYEEKK